MFGKCNVGFERLVEFALGELPDEDRQVLEAHLAAGCTCCHREVEWLRDLLATAHVDDSVEPPAWVLRRAASLFARRQSDPSPASAPALVARVLARLVFDSRLAMAASPVRNGALRSQQLLFSAENLDVDLHIESGERQAEFTLMGQVLPAEGGLDQVEGAEVHILRGHRKMLSKTTDAFGEFVFGRLPAGRYTVRIRVRDREFELAGIDL